MSAEPKFSVPPPPEGVILPFPNKNNEPSLLNHLGTSFKKLGQEEILPRAETAAVLVVENLKDLPNKYEKMKDRVERKRQAGAQRLMDSKLEGMLDVLVKENQIEWYHLRPDTGQVDLKGLAQLPQFGEGGMYADVLAYMEAKDYRFNDKSKLRQEAVALWPEEIRRYEEWKKQEDTRKLALTLPTLTRDPVVITTDDEKLDNLMNTVGTTPPSTTTVTRTVKTEPPSRWRMFQGGWGGPPRGPFLTEGEIKSRQRKIALSGAIVLFGIIVLATGSKIHLSDANPANWGIFSAFKNEPARTVSAPDIAPTALPTVELPSGDVIINIPPVVINPTAAPTVVLKPTTVTIVEGKSLADGTREISRNLNIQTPPEIIEIPPTQFGVPNHENVIRFPGEDSRHKEIVGDGNISDVVGISEGAIINQGGIVYDAAHIKAFHEIKAVDPVIQGAVDQGAADLVSSNPAENFAIVRDRVVAKHTIDGRELTYRAPDWNRSFGNAAISRLQDWYAGKMPNTARVAPNT